MSELFNNLPESKSPRLIWMERHGVETGGPDEDEEFWAMGLDRQSKPDYGYGQTEHDAIVHLAKRNGWRLWNEEGATR